MSAAVLAFSLTACGGGTSDNTLQTGVGGVAGTGRVTVPPGPVVVPTPPLQDNTGTGMSATELAFASEVFRLVNEYRVANGRAALAWDAPTAAVAQAHTANMLALGVLTHAGPPPCTVPAVCLPARANAGAVAFTAVGENIARGQSTAQQVMADWQASPGHNQNLLDPGWTHMGVGYKAGTSPVNPAATGPWWTQVFITR